MMFSCFPQRYYEREFSSLLQKMRDPPPILSRARFLMGSAMGGGGITTMCEVRHCYCTTTSHFNAMKAMRIYQFIIWLLFVVWCI
jgi:hypothetical protein